MDSIGLADMIVVYLNAAPGIAKAGVVEDLDGVVSGLVETQGGQRFAFAVEPADG